MKCEHKERNGIDVPRPPVVLDRAVVARHARRGVRTLPQWCSLLCVQIPFINILYGLMSIYNMQFGHLEIHGACCSDLVWTTDDAAFRSIDARIDVDDAAERAVLRVSLFGA